MRCRFMMMGSGILNAVALPYLIHVTLVKLLGSAV